MSPNPSVLPLPELLRAVELHRVRGERVVFTNGCFDLLHVGHVRYLQEARQLGDILIVGINSDDSVRRLKGPRRPIVPASERAEIIAALACVSYATVFEEDTPNAVIAAIRPDIHVKGGDYSAADLPEAPLVESYGGMVCILPFVEGRSTSDWVSKIIQRYKSDLTHGD